MSMRYNFTKQIYDKDALLKAAYSFTDKAYIHLDADEENYIVYIEAKNNENLINEKEFQNEILAQMVRKKIAEQTKTVRELMIARAFSSTIIDNNANQLQYECSNDIEADDILLDWFEKYE